MILDPTTVFWESLGRHMLAPEEQSNDIEKDAARALTKAYPHILSDRDRLMQMLLRARDPRVKDMTLKKWGKSAASCDDGRAMADDPDLRPEEADALGKALLTEKRRPSGRLPENRLTTSNLIVAIHERPGLLIANNTVAHPERIDFRPCSGALAYMAALLDAVLFEPPDRPFLVAEFEKRTIAPGDLVLNIPGSDANIRTVRTSGPLGGIIRRERMLALVEMVRGIVDANLLRSLAEWERERLARGEGDFNRLDKLADKLPDGLDVDDLLDLMPRPDGLEWRLLRAALRPQNVALSAVK